MKLTEQTNRIKSIMGILNEENKIPLAILRRLEISNIDEMIKKFSRQAFYYKTNESVERLIQITFNLTIDNIFGYIDDNLLDDEKFKKDFYTALEIIRKNLKEKYTQTLKDYFEKRINDDNNQSKNIYTFIKHSEPNPLAPNSVGFSDSFYNMEDLIYKFGTWLDNANWDDIIEKHNNMDEGTILIAKPNENSMGYYFTIKKRKK